MMTRSKKILYVEDDLVTLTAYQKRLQQEGFAVEAACDGIQAMNILRQREPDLVLLDLVLPKFDGEDVLKFIYSVPRLSRIPVIILSTNSAICLKNEPLLEKANGHLLKHDCTFQKLLGEIEKVLNVVETSIHPRVTTSKPRACPMEVPRVLSFLQLNLRGVDPVSLNQTSLHLPTIIG